MFFDSLDYYILAEVCTVIFSIILLYNIFKTFSPYERKHRFFLYATLACLFSAVFDIISVFCTTYYKVVEPALSMGIQTGFYIILVFIPLIITCYSFDLSFSNRKKPVCLYSIVYSVYVVYVILLFINLKTGWIFTVDKINGYQKGPLKNITYILSFIYIIFIEVNLFIHKNSISKRIAHIIMLYPVIGGGLVFVQFFYPKILLTGTSSLASLLLCYMAIQSDMLDFDMTTGLMTEHKLENYIQQKGTQGVLFVLSIENIEFFESNLANYDFDSFLFEIAKKIQKLFGSGYYSADHRFYAIAKTEDELPVKYAKLKEFFEDLYFDPNSFITVMVDFHAAALNFSKGNKSYCNVKNIINNLLYRSKVEGLKNIKFCDETVLMQMARKEKIYEILKRELTLESEQFTVYYQPIYSVKEGRFVYMEALSRLGGTELGSISPAEFVPVAESRGLIERLGNVAFEKICKFISDNRSVVEAVSINFSVYQMTKPGIVKKVLGTIARFGLNPSNIIMEITESIFIENFEVVSKNMCELAEAGIKFYLDDFGNGYSNLANVVNLPFSTVKIDRTLVLAMENNHKSYVLFSNLVSTFKGSDLCVLAEGVENDKQNDQVTAAGVDYIQGFLYSRPLSPQDCLSLLKKNRK